MPITFIRLAPQSEWKFDDHDQLREVTTKSPDGYYLAFKHFSNGEQVAISDYVQIIVVGPMHHTPRQLVDAACGPDLGIDSTGFMDGSNEGADDYVKGHGFISIIARRPRPPKDEESRSVGLSVTCLP